MNARREKTWWQVTSGRWKNRSSNLLLFLQLFWPPFCNSYRMQSFTKIRRFEDLAVWQKAMDLVEEVYLITRQGELSRDRGFKFQLRRAAVSIPSNIAEGFERYSALELKQFLNIAKGSAGEVRTQLKLARNLGYIETIEAENLLKRCEEVSRMLSVYRKKVGRKK